MKWVIGGFLAVMLYLERHGLVGLYRRIRSLIKRKNEMKEPRYDGHEAIGEILDWCAEPVEVKDRVARLKKSIASSLAFHFFIRQVSDNDFKFTEVAELGIDYRPSRLDRWLSAHNTNSWLELTRYADDSTLPLERRKNQLTQLLDHVWAPEAEIMKSVILGDYKLPDRLNHVIVEMALGEGQDQPT